MPTDEDAIEYVEAILEYLDDLSSDEENDNTEFLTEYLNRKDFQGLVEVYDLLKDDGDKDSPTLACNALNSVLGDLNGIMEQSEEATELYELLSKPHVMALVQSYDDIVNGRYEPELEENAMMDGDLSERRSIQAPPSDLTSVTEATAPTRGPVQELTKTIALRKAPDETLGITVVRREYADGPHMRSAIMVERILSGSVIDRQSLLHVGDIIQEVNNQPIDTPEALQRLMKQNNSGTVVFKIAPAYQRQSSSQKKVYVKTYFSYNPDSDSLIPCRDAGLAFECGEILEMVNQEDPNWWQARRLGTEGPHAGLVPSLTLEERRKAFRPMSDEFLKNYSVMSCGPFGRRSSKKKNVQIYRAADAPTNFQDSDILIYEEVRQVPPSRVPVVLLVGASGVGRRAVKRRLCDLFPNEFAQPVVWTTRAITGDPRDMAQFQHVDREDMMAASRKGLMVEWGRDGPDYYGVAFESVRKVVHTGVTAVMDCRPQTVRLVRQGEFRPFVVFLAAPAVDVQRVMYQRGLQKGLTREVKTDDSFKATVEQSCGMERAYRHIFDLMLLNDDIEKTVSVIADKVYQVSQEPRWIPVQWAMEDEDEESLSLLRPA